MSTDVTIWITGKRIMERDLPGCSSQPVAPPDDLR